MPLRTYVYPRLSPDGTKVAMDVRDQEQDIWIWDFVHETLTRLTFDPVTDTYPVWTPDGKRVVFGSARNGPSNLYWQSSDGTGTAERLTTSPNIQNAFSMSPDGTQLVLGEGAPGGGGLDLAVLHLNAPSTALGTGPSTTLGTGPSTAPGAGPSTPLAAGQGRTEPLIQTAFTESNGETSPDGHWLAYQSNESGQFQIYVRPCPNVNGGRWQVSSGGGTKPLWARSGRELFYVDANGVLTTVPVTAAATFNAGNPTKVFDTRYFSAAGRTYDVSPDGKKFLMIKNAGGDQTSANAPSAPMTVVLNWLEELKVKVPVK